MNEMDLQTASHPLAESNLPGSRATYAGPRTPFIDRPSDGALSSSSYAADVLAREEEMKARTREHEKKKKLTEFSYNVKASAKTFARRKKEEEEARLSEARQAAEEKKNRLQKLNQKVKEQVGAKVAKNKGKRSTLEAQSSVEEGQIVPLNSDLRTVIERTAEEEETRLSASRLPVPALPPPKENEYDFPSRELRALTYSGEKTKDFRDGLSRGILCDNGINAKSVSEDAVP